MIVLMLSVPVTANLGSQIHITIQNEARPTPEVVRTIIYNGQVNPQNTALQHYLNHWLRNCSQQLPPAVPNVASANVI
jgi:hypothetical protein